jgi:AraC family transcriptional regulator
MKSVRLADENYKILLRRDTGNAVLRKVGYTSEHHSARHFHKNARFVFVLEGSFAERYEKKERVCQPFTCIFRPPLEKHSETYNRGAVYLSVDISPIWMERLENYSIKLNQSKDFRNRSATFLINKICEEMVFDDEVSSLAIDALLTEIAVETHRSLSVAKREKTPRWLTVVIEYIHGHFLSNLTLNEIASAANVHPVHLARVFRKTYHSTVADYIRRLRIESASRMLSESNLTLAEIAAENGFTDQSHFTKVFKRLTNKTPAEFKKIYGKAN